jgi:protein TonB
MMMQAAGAGGGVLQSLNESGGRRRIPPWLWGALGVSLTLHVAGVYWLYNQHWKAPPALDDGRVSIVQLLPPIPKVTPPPKPLTPIKPNTNTIHKADPIVTTPDKDVHHLTAVNSDAKDTLVGPTGPADFSNNTGSSGESGGGGGTATKPSVILNPTWLSQPDGEAMSRFYPPGAAAAGIEGAASIHCVVTINGTLSNCTVASETPPRQGFGNAAKHLAPYFRMKPKTVDGQPVEGAEVTIPIRFRMN